MTYSRFLIAGLCISVLFHGAGSAFFAKDPDEVSVAASKGGAVSVIGSIEDMVAGSQVDAVEVTEPLKELEPETELIEPVEEPTENIEVDNTPVATPVRPVEIQTQKVAAVTPVTSAEAVPVVQGITSIEAVTSTEVNKDREPEEVKPAETSVDEVKTVVQEDTLVATQSTEEIAEAKPAEAAQPTQPTVVAALEKTVEAAQPEQASPTPPLEQVQQASEVQKQLDPLELVNKTPVKKPAPPVKKAETKKKPKKAQQRGGKTNARKGGEQITSTSARSNANGRADAKTNDGGVKAASNYKGKVVAKLRRAKRYPKKAQRKKLTGTARVAFTISRSGSVSGIRISRSSGHAILDQAALEMVKRASPMPKFPGDIRQARMTLQVPVRFDR